MNRIVIGCAGSGKSTLARKLGERLGLPVVHLDAISWQPGWRPVSIDVFRERLAEALSADVWITDGNYALRSFDLRLPSADLVIWIEKPILHCLWRVLRRAFTNHFNADEDLAYRCKERFDARFLDRLHYIARFNRVNRPRVEAARTAHGPDVPVITLRTDREIAAFLALVADNSNRKTPNFPNRAKEGERPQKWLESKS